jgi:hypothetical protein
MELEAVAEENTGGMLHDTADSFLVRLQWVHEIQRISYWTCSHEDHIYTNSPWKWAFVHELYTSVAQKITNILHIETVASFSEFFVLTLEQMSLHILYKKKRTKPNSSLCFSYTELKWRRFTVPWVLLSDAR